MDLIQDIPLISRLARPVASVRRGALTTVALALILGVALALRLYGLDWDEGFSYTPHPDERAILFNVDDLAPPPLGDLGVLLDAERSPWNPKWFNYGSLPLYMLKGIQLAGTALPGEEVRDLRLAGRAMSALADVVAVALVFLIGRGMYGTRVGLMASMLVALSVIHIQLSHFFAVDTMQALFAVATLYFLFRVGRNGRPRDSVLAGAFIGLGLATKVSQAPILAAFAVAHLMYLFSMNGASEDGASGFEERLKRVVKGIVAGGAASLAALFFTQPYGFLDYSRFLEDVAEQSEMVRRIRDYPYTRQYIDTAPYLYQIKQHITWGLGWPLGVVAWAGLLYVSLRGMRLRYGALYLLFGWAVPVGMLLVSTGFLAMFLAVAVALLSLVATLPVRREDTRMDVLLLAWVVPHFLITGAFQVKFLRYLIPITPFLVLFGSRMLFAGLDRVSGYRVSLRPLMVVPMVAVVGATAFYAVSYTGVYGQTHTAVRASDWLNRNAPKGAVILKEHWEEGLPGLREYEVRELPLYDVDGEQKFELLSEQLAEADYIVFFSNRLYGTIPRIPDRYPISSRYYNELFGGRLGYELARFEATYPEFLGVGFVDETFGRSDVPVPGSLRGYRPSPITLNLGVADESFTVYDHPKVLIFENVERLDAETIKRRIEGVRPNYPKTTVVIEEKIGLLLSDEDAAAQQRGGSWSDIVSPDGFASRFPVLGWLIVMEVFGLIAIPITFLVFRPLEDRGYLFSKAIGLLLVGLIVWLLASLQWLAFSRTSVVLAAVLLAMTSGVLLVSRRAEIVGFVRSRWRLMLIGEVIFLAAFFAFLMIRMANPDLWHPFRGGEKPMDFAYLNAVVRSSYMPPYDPWFSGGYINYYYWGQFLTGTLIRATGIEPAIAFNLAVPLFFAMTAAGAYTIVYNLAEGTRRRLARSGERTGHSLSDIGEEVYLKNPSPAQGENILERPPDGESDAVSGWRNLKKSPIAAGLVGVLFATVMGNLDGAIQVGHGIKRAVFQNAPFGQFDFWRSSRMMPPDPPGNEITEFPYFTFLFGDLHAHLMALPFTLLALGLALAVIVRAVERRDGGLWSLESVVRLGLLGVAVGSLRVINAWDFPTYLIVGGAAVLLAEYFAHGGLSLGVLVRAGVKSIYIFAAGYIAFLPYHQSYETFFNSVESTTNTTVLWQFLAITGLFIFIIGSFLLAESRGPIFRGFRGLIARYLAFARLVSASEAETGPASPRVSAGWWGAGIFIGTVVFGYFLTAWVTGAAGSTAPFVLLLLALVAVTGVGRLASNRPDAAYIAFVGLIVAVSLLLVIGLDFIRMNGDIDRMNSIFKFYLQVWVMLALASAFLLWYMGHRRRVSIRRMAVGKKVWSIALIALILSASIYPVLGTQDRLRDRFDDRTTPLTLDGTAFISGSVYRDEKGDIDLAIDYEGIEWLKRNAQGSPVVLEGVTPLYRWGGRVSIYTGLPSVVGWDWHQQQQRWGYRESVNRRVRDVKRFYQTTNVREAVEILEHYNVRYVYLGRLERLYFPGRGLIKFEGGLSDKLTKVFENEDVRIFEVQDGEF